MATLKNIITNNWDTDICTAPTVIKLQLKNWRAYKRVLGIRRVQRIDEIKGIVSRSYFDTEAHDAYECIITTMTSEDDFNNMIEALKKVCATYTPTSTENILEWTGGEIEMFNEVRWVFRCILIVNRSGITAYS